MGKAAAQEAHGQLQYYKPHPQTAEKHNLTNLHSKFKKLHSRGHLQAWTQSVGTEESYRLLTQQVGVSRASKVAQWIWMVQQQQQWQG